MKNLLSRLCIGCLLLFFCGVNTAKASITLKVGETHTCTLSNVPSHLQGCQWTSSRPFDVQIISNVSTYTTSVTIKAVNAFSGPPCVIHCQYYYLELDPTTGRYTYSRSGYQDWNIFVHDVEPTGISLSSTLLTLDVGASATLTANVQPSNASTSLTWKSSSSSIARVSSIGDNRANITAESPGECTITVTASNGISATCTVNVNALDPTKITISPTSLELMENQLKTLSYTLYPSGSSADVTWSSGDDNIATVTQTGLVKGISQGKTSIIVSTSNGLTDVIEVTVLPSVQRITLSDAQLFVGYSKILIPVLEPEGISSELIWSSSDNLVATVDNNGCIRANKEGKTTIRVTTENNRQAEATITVVKPENAFNVRNVKQHISVVENLLKKVK